MGGTYPTNVTPQARTPTFNSSGSSLTPSEQALFKRTMNSIRDENQFRKLLSDTALQKRILRSSVPLIGLALRSTPVGRAVWLASRLIRFLPDFTWNWTGQYIDQFQGWVQCGECTGPTPGGKTGEVTWYYQSYVPGLPLPTQCGQANSCVATAPPTGSQPVNPRIRVLWDLYTLSGSGTARAMMRKTWYRTAADAWVPSDGTSTLRLVNYDIGYLHRYNSIHYFYQPIIKMAEVTKTLPINDLPYRQPDPLQNSSRGNEQPGSEPRSRPQASYVPRPLQSMLQIRPHTRNVAYGRTKEKKFQGSSEAVQEFFRVVSRAKESVTEFKDFLEAWIEALPKELQKVPKAGKFATPQEMLKHIYDNLDKIDGEQLMKNIAYNYLEDKVIGAGIKAGDKFAKAVGLKATTQIRGATLPKWQRI